MSKKVSLDVAKTELKRWFEACRFRESKITRFKADESEASDVDQESEASKDEHAGDCIEGLLLEAICDGAISVDEKGMISQNLDFPLTKGGGNEKVLETLTFRPRLTVQDVNKVSNGVKPGDQRGNMVANTAARTGVNRNLITLMDTEDFDTTALIMAYFL